MNLEPRLPFPIRVRKLHLETVRSYTRRLAAANYLTDSYLKWLLAEIRSNSNATLNEAELTVALQAGAVEPDRFDRFQHRTPAHHCETCDDGIKSRTMCRLCSNGQVVEQSPHFEGNICLRHKIWVGPGADLEAQQPAPHDSIAAELRFKKLVRMGRIDSHRYREMQIIVRRWRDSLGDGGGDDLTRYVSVIDICSLVSDTRFMSDLLSRDRTFAQSYGLLAARLGSAVPGSNVVLCDGVWLLMRPLFLRAWEEQHFGRALAPHSCHELYPAVRFANNQFPLEPFFRFLSVITTCLSDRWQDAASKLVSHTSLGLPRVALSAKRSEKASVICAEGHRIEVAIKSLRKAVFEDTRGCGVCFGSTAIPGYNGLAETAPHLLLFWHTEKNGSIDPLSLRSGSIRSFWWRCGNGHEWQMQPRAQRRSTSCHRAGCSMPPPRIDLDDYAQLVRERGMRAITIDVTHPELASEWHPTLNSDTPNQHVPWSTAKRWFRCRHGHDYRVSVAIRTERNSGCGICGNKELLVGFNDLESKFPALAEEWHPNRNNGLKARDVIATGHAKKRWWICKLGHEWEAAIYYRAQGKNGCPFCAKNRVLPGFNDFQTRFPEVARRWHPTLNGTLLASEVSSRSTKPAHWLCEAGHSFALSPRSLLKRSDLFTCRVCPRSARSQ